MGKGYKNFIVPWHSRIQTVNFKNLVRNIPNSTMSIHSNRVIVGAPRGTYPGGLALDDPGEPAENRTGLVYTCSVTPDGDCGPVLGDDQTGEMINDLTITVNNDFLSAGSRLFDHRRE